MGINQQLFTPHNHEHLTTTQQQPTNQHVRRRPQGIWRQGFRGHEARLAEDDHREVGRGATDIGDKAARSVQPNEDKSATQKMGDTMSGNKDQATSGGTGGGIINKAKDTLGMNK